MTSFLCTAVLLVVLAEPYGAENTQLVRIPVDGSFKSDLSNIGNDFITKNKKLDQLFGDAPTQQQTPRTTSGGKQTHTSANEATVHQRLRDAPTSGEKPNPTPPSGGPHNSTTTSGPQSGVVTSNKTQKNKMQRGNTESSTDTAALDSNSFNGFGKSGISKFYVQNKKSKQRRKGGKKSHSNKKCKPCVPCYEGPPPPPCTVYEWKNCTGMTINVGPVQPAECNCYCHDEEDDDDDNEDDC